MNELKELAAGFRVAPETWEKYKDEMYQRLKRVKEINYNGSDFVIHEPELVDGDFQVVMTFRGYCQVHEFTRYLPLEDDCYTYAKSCLNCSAGSFIDILEPYNG